MRALSIKQSSCSGQLFIRSSSNLRRHSSLCFRFVNPDRPRRVARRYNLGDLIGD